MDFLKTVDLFKLLLSRGGVMAANHEQDKKGTVRWSKSGGKGEHQRGQLAQGQFFGEHALRTKEKRAATISIDTNKEVVLLSMTGRSFEELLGPVLEMVDAQIKEYRRPTATTHRGRPALDMVDELNENKTIWSRGRLRFEDAELNLRTFMMYVITQGGMKQEQHKTLLRTFIKQAGGARREQEVSKVCIYAQFVLFAG